MTETPQNNERHLIPVEIPSTNFQDFLNIDNNKKIFFSGKFGTGKTFFLDQFFQQNDDKYDVYHLYPVRYQISSNENIIELIKYDILVELFKKYPQISSKEANLKELIYAYAKEKFTLKSTAELLLPILSKISLLGRAYEEICKIYNDFQDFAQKHIDEERHIIGEFEKKMKNMDPFATDPLSIILEAKIKENKNNKKSVLILDDFDRIDPEHIFRILNILSSQFCPDKESEHNKFGFDHIIIVGDIINIKSIFHHRYGENTDFEGYFDKFFSVCVFNYDNGVAVNETLPKILLKIKYSDQKLAGALAQNGIINFLLKDILVQALGLRIINLRRLYSLTTYDFPELKVPFYTEGTKRLYLNTAIKLVVSIFGYDKDHTLININKIIQHAGTTPLIGYATALPELLGSLTEIKNLNYEELKMYSISKDEGRFNKPYVNNVSALLFYKILYEYIFQEKYLKNEEW